MATGAPLVHIEAGIVFDLACGSSYLHHGHSIHYDDVTIVVVTKTTDRPGRTYRGMYFTNYV